MLAAIPAGWAWLSGASTWWFSLLGTLLGGVLLTGIAYTLLFPRARRQSLAQFAKIQKHLALARELEQTARAEAVASSRQLAKEIEQCLDADIAAARAERDKTVAQADADRAAQSEKLRAELQDQTQQQATQRDSAIQAAIAKYPPLLEHLAIERQAARCDAEIEFTERKDQAQQTHNQAWNEMAKAWQSGFAHIAGELASANRQCEQMFPDWTTTAWDEWHRPDPAPRAICFGHCRLPLAHVKNGLPEDERLHPGVNSLRIPALLALDEQPRMVILTEDKTIGDKSKAGNGQRAAAEVMQLVMLRFLTAMPAGKLRMTMVDAAGLGENFGAFLQLADIDEPLVGGRVWTEGRQIDERLSLLCEHMEKVLQQYLRNEFATIDEYNQQAGEVAEPYQLLVVANFPAGFSDAAAAKLMKIANKGPRCGVYLLLSVDTQLPMPREFRLQELIEGAVQLEWKNERLLWRYPLFEKLSLELDPLPPADRLNSVLRAAGRQSREASRVEVPFSLVAPEEDKIWSADSAKELCAPIGRASANQLQSLRLGIGTSQHVLISGKTGSGKSTLLHALVTNLALHYSPQQVEFYLVDFKKGVEFKTYATAQLPHARVIAIESEREFGVSVLERLDEELKRRGELFRELGVQDLAGYRGEVDVARRASRCDAATTLPRILLVIDEFQELFVTDDKLAQDAALLLDRLVRQGRAFGMHVLLGSQTLSGAYSLARSTLGQMAVRIALECSESDAHLILSDENTAARLLNRPGEAIYNDENGRVAGNHSFQVVWLPDAQRQAYLATIRDRQVACGLAVEPPIVFEGNLPADPNDNKALQQAVETDHGPAIAEPTIWLGSAVRIEPPTHVTLRRQGGNHLLVVGQQEPLALGILATATIALAASSRQSTAQFTILDGTRPESHQRGAWKEVAAAMAVESALSDVHGTEVQIIGPRDAADSINALADEVARRCEATRQYKTTDQPHPPHYLVIHDLAQFRDLRQSEDDFSFSTTNSKPPSVDRRFREILREGPAVGVHLLVWADSYNSLSRTIDRMTLREIDYRVALPMSASDSTSLIDSPEAGRLGEHRAIFYRDDLGTQQKFRPYQRPTAEWLDWVSQQLSRHSVARS